MDAVPDAEVSGPSHQALLRSANPGVLGTVAGLMAEELSAFFALSAHQVIDKIASLAATLAAQSLAVSLHHRVFDEVGWFGHVPSIFWVWWGHWNEQPNSSVWTWSMQISR